MDITRRLTPFATLKYVEGTDHTRSGDFATVQAEPGMPSTRDFNRPRGFFSGVPGAPSEPLPGILPLEARVGLRFHEARQNPRWGTELSARAVDDQDRVAASLLETPTPGFTVWDLRTFWRPRTNLLVVGGIENFTDKLYREHLDFRSLDGISVFQPGVNFYVGSEVTY
jgi:outer membrane receptor protein involved in Fe transport